jgi:hypothetical protein
MSDNPFSTFNITTPRKFTEEIKKYCHTSGGKVSPKYSPFKRQVDFWFLAFCYAVKKDLEPIKEVDVVNMTQATILSQESYRVSFIQLSYLGNYQDVNLLAEHKVVFDWAIGMANAGIPYILQILSDSEDTPLNNMLDEIEALLG